MIVQHALNFWTGIKELSRIRKKQGLYEEGKVVVTQDRNMMDKSKMADKRGKEGPLVSIVTPSYNQGQFIEETTLSVKNQDYPNIEHIVVYGGSTDEILEILKRYEGTYNLRWISEPDEGHADAVNKGFAMAKGEIISWLNSDDVYFDKGTISSVMEAFQRHSEADIVYGNCVINL